MEFEGQYLTYEEYKALGGTLDLTPFNILEFEARRRIDVRTQNRLKDGEDKIPQEVKLCEYEIISNINSYIVQKDNISENGNIASVSTDGYSESYVTSAQIQSIFASKEAEIRQAILTYLIGVEYEGKNIIFDGRDYVK